MNRQKLIIAITIILLFLVLYFLIFKNSSYVKDDYGNKYLIENNDKLKLDEINTNEIDNAKQNNSKIYMDDIVNIYGSPNVKVTSKHNQKSIYIYRVKDDNSALYIMFENKEVYKYKVDDFNGLNGIKGQDISDILK